ncbi:hypothetical protein BZM98_005092 [Escherichia coli]|nr:hypothetical protein [Escherichia coli]
MASSAKPRKRKPAPQRSKLPRYVVKLHDDDFFDEEDAEALRFDNFDDAVECCADLNIPFFVDAGNKKLVFWGSVWETESMVTPVFATPILTISGLA